MIYLQRFGLQTDRNSVYLHGVVESMIRCLKRSKLKGVVFHVLGTKKHGLRVTLHRYVIKIAVSDLNEDGEFLTL